MCGIIGIIESKSLAEELYAGLLGLQHRGQDFAGIQSYDPNHSISESGISSEITAGLVDNLSSRLDQIVGSLGIGQVRYPTIGGGQLKDAQPRYDSSADSVGMVHNGNVINYLSLKEALCAKRRFVVSNNDVEVILKVFVDEYAKQNPGIEGINESVKQVYNQVIGAYSVLSLIHNQGLVAFRDPQGIRPLVYGKRRADNKDSYGFCSESQILTSLGFSEIKDVITGTVMVADLEGKLHFTSLVQEQHAHCAFEYIYFADPSATMESRVVYQARAKTGIVLAQKIKEMGLEADVVVCLPDSGRITAIALAQELNLPYHEAFIKNRYISRTFIMPNQKKRATAARMKHNLVPGIVEDKRVILVDDSLVRGTTSAPRIKILREAGAKQVYFATSYPKVTHPCFYGVDMQTEEELIANKLNTDEIAAKIGADFFIPNETPELKTCIGLDDLCTACCSGIYPTDIKEAKKLQELRKEHQKK